MDEQESRAKGDREKGCETWMMIPGASSTPALTAGIEINNAGQITGQFCDSSESCHGFLATPRSPSWVR